MESSQWALPHSFRESEVNNTSQHVKLTQDLFSHTMRARRNALGEERGDSGFRASLGDRGVRPTRATLRARGTMTLPPSRRSDRTVDDKTTTTILSLWSPQLLPLAIDSALFVTLWLQCSYWIGGTAPWLA